MKVTKRPWTASSRTLTVLTTHVQHDFIQLEGKSGFHVIGQMKVTTPENANQLAVDQNRERHRKPIVKNEILSGMEDLQHY